MCFSALLWMTLCAFAKVDTSSMMCGTWNGVGCGMVTGRTICGSTPGVFCALVSPCAGLEDSFRCWIVGCHSGGCIAHPLNVWYCGLVIKVIHPLFGVFIHPLFWIRGGSAIEKSVKVSGQHFEDTNCPAVPSNGDHIFLEFSRQFSDV